MFTIGSAVDDASKARNQSATIAEFLVQAISKNSAAVISDAAAHFGITRQAVHRHLRKLEEQGLVLSEGNTRAKLYKLAVLREVAKWYEIIPTLAEDQVWFRDVQPLIASLPENVKSIWEYCFTEMFNNAIDHSQGKSIGVEIKMTAASTRISLFDDGIGIFRKIRTALNLVDERNAVLELAKGKLTTDPSNHTGQGIFFTSRLLDSFDILSGDVFFTHFMENNEDWILEGRNNKGTSIFMELSNSSNRLDKVIFDAFSTDDNYGFTKTVVPVRLARYGKEKLVSRSQAKRLMARVELFKTVLLDFSEIESIGQAFADEIFRVFAKQHPEVSILPMKANAEVSDQIGAAQRQKESDLQSAMMYS